MSYSSSSALDNLIAAQKRSRQHPDGEDGHLPTVTEASTYGDILVHAQKNYDFKFSFLQERATH